jgi:hypothetical protein
MRKNNRTLLTLALLGLLTALILPGRAWAGPAGAEPAVETRQEGEPTTVSLTTLPASVSDCGVLDLYIDVNMSKTCTAWTCA